MILHKDAAVLNPPNYSNFILLSIVSFFRGEAIVCEIIVFEGENVIDATNVFDFAN